MARLHPEVSAFRVLMTTEGLEDLPNALMTTAGLFGFLGGYTPVHLGIAAFCSYLAGILIVEGGLFIVPGLMALGTSYAYVSIWGAVPIALGILGFFAVGWKGLLGFWFGKLLAFGIGWFVQFQFTKEAYKEVGFAFTASERRFFQAYKAHATRIGVTIDVNVTEKEMKEDNWLPAFTDLATKWPQVTARFGKE